MKATRERLDAYLAVVGVPALNETAATAVASFLQEERRRFAMRVLCLRRERHDDVYRAIIAEAESAEAEDE